MTGLPPETRRTRFIAPSAESMHSNLCVYNCLRQELLFQNLVAATLTAAVINLSVGPGEAAKLALLTKSLELGICCTERLSKVLYRHIAHWALSEMGREVERQVRGGQELSGGCPRHGV